ncbi:hypothetical protein DFQ26_003145, partial [Actinomortierella ambigua]
YPIVDLYRGTVDAAIRNAASVPEGSSDEIKRSMDGILVVMDLMAKSSITTNNADLVKVQPIFAADVLGPFRDVYVSLADKDEQELFAVAGLSLTIGASNALEGCLRIAKDPTAAIEDIHADLGFENVEEDVAGAPDQANEEGSQGPQDPPTQAQQQQPLNWGSRFQGESVATASPGYCCFSGLHARHNGGKLRAQHRRRAIIAVTNER